MDHAGSDAPELTPPAPQHRRGPVLWCEGVAASPRSRRDFLGAAGPVVAGFTFGCDALPAILVSVGFILVIILGTLRTTLARPPCPDGSWRAVSVMTESVLLPKTSPWDGDSRRRRYEGSSLAVLDGWLFWTPPGGGSAAAAAAELEPKGRTGGGVKAMVASPRRSRQLAPGVGAVR